MVKRLVLGTAYLVLREGSCRELLRGEVGEQELGMLRRLSPNCFGYITDCKVCWVCFLPAAKDLECCLVRTGDDGNHRRSCFQFRLYANVNESG